MKLGFRDLRPSRRDLRQALPPVLRGTVIGSLCSLIPGTGPTIASFIAYAAEKKLSKTPGRFGHGAIEGVAAPEASTHSAVQGDFIPTMSLGIPGDAVMALLLGALMIHGIQPGPRLIVEQPDIFWGLIASFWIGNIILVVLNVPMIGIWVKLLSVPYRYPVPDALFFVCIGVFSARNEMFDVAQRWCSARSATCCCSWASSRRRSCWASCWGRGSRRTSAGPCCCRAGASRRSWTGRSAPCSWVCARS